MTNLNFNFTKTTLNALPTPSEGKRVMYHDTLVSGLALRVTSSGYKSFLVYKKVNQTPIKAILGKFPDMKIDQARKQAIKMISEMLDGVNPNQKKKQAIMAKITLGEVFEEYLSTRSSLKDGTVLDYKKTMRQTFDDWMDQPLAKIDKTKVRARHQKRSKESKARADNAFRVLRALFNFATEIYEDEDGKSLFPINPVTVLSKTRSWNNVDRRKTVIKADQLAVWFKAVNELESTHFNDKTKVVKAYLLFLLFTGVRREEGARLKWEDIDFEERSFFLTDTKNKEQVTLPLPEYLINMLIDFREESQGDFVFCGEGKTGHLVNPSKQIKRVEDKSGLEFTLHDLRRTYITILESLDISQYTLKRLVNHKTGEKQDVTAGYVITDLERLRKASDKVANHILELVENE